MVSAGVSGTNGARTCFSSFHVFDYFVAVFAVK